MVGNEIEESAKAVKEVAKTGGKAIDATRELGGFFARIFGGSLDQVGGILEDTLRFRRGVRLLRLRRRFDEIRAELGLNAELMPVVMKIGVPLLQAASLEESDEIQDMYAQLLVNATDPSAKVRAQRSFVTILQDLGPLEVLLLDRLYNAPGGPHVATPKLPNAYLGPNEDRNQLPPDEVQLALWNLVRLGCVEPQSESWAGGSSVSVVMLTPLGRKFVEACTRVVPREAAGGHR